MALFGLVGLVAPGVYAPSIVGAVLMFGAGIAWGTYSLLGRHNTDPLGATAGNFLRASPMALAVALLMTSGSPPMLGLAYAVLSGAFASGLGYAIWYAALPGLSSVEASSVQLSVPVIAAVGGAFMLEEPLTVRLAISSAVVLGGIALVTTSRVEKIRGWHR